MAGQLAFLVVFLAGAASRFNEQQLQRTLPPLRSTPLEVLPEYDYDVVVSDEQLRRILSKLVPRDLGEKTGINHVDHALRFWGIEAKFDDPQLLSGEAMRRLLVDHRRFAEVYGPNRPSLLIDQSPGVSVRVQEGSATSSHVDHTLATLAEVGTPLNFPIQTATRETTFGEVLRQSLRDFSLNQVEYEWSAMAFALYFPPGVTWVSSEGQELDFDRIATRIMRQEMPQGVCYGNHRLYTLVILLRVDQMDPENPILSKTKRRQIVDYLKEMTAKLVRNQHPAGFWNTNWPRSAPTSLEPTDDESDSLSRRILVTGHTLEWWAMAPSEVHPPRPVLAAAGQWLVTALDGLTDEQLSEFYPFLTHAGRCLALWRSRPPAHVDLGL